MRFSRTRMSAEFCRDAFAPSLKVKYKFPTTPFYGKSAYFVKKYCQSKARIRRPIPKSKVDKTIFVISYCVFYFRVPNKKQHETTRNRFPHPAP